jgi:hypothetical protein
MRADFLGKCAEYAELAQKIDQHLVMVKPMTSPGDRRGDYQTG